MPPLLTVPVDLLDRWLVRNKKGDAGNCGVGAGGFQPGNKCAASGGGSGAPAVYPAAALAVAQARAKKKFADAPKPTAEEVAGNNKKMDEVGADRFEASARGNSKDRAASREKLLTEFGDGTHCPCIYCGLKLGDSSVTRDKMYTARQGGKYRHSNLVPACLSCNQSRGDKPFKDAL